MIKVLCVGKLKEDYLQAAVCEYEKRISKYAKLKIIEVSDFHYEDIHKTKEKEGEELLKHIEEKDYVITLDIAGKQLDSLSFAANLDKLEMQHANLCFVIGGSYGLASSLTQRAQMTLSFSKMTFPHQLFRVLFLEQLYRAYKINHNEKYHK